MLRASRQFCLGRCSLQLIKDKGRPMAALHRQIDALKSQVAELIAVLKSLPIGHSHKFVGRPDVNDDTDGQTAPVCVDNCPACLRESVLAKYGVL